MRALRRVFWVAGLLLFGLLLAQVGAEAGYPDKAVDFVAPASPGGGWDLTCRLSAKVLKEAGLVTQPIVVSNKVGGFGMVAMTDIVRNRRKDDNLYDEEMVITPLLDGRGEIASFIAIKQDITLCPWAQEQLRWP